MNADQARAIVAEVLAQIAPEADLADVEPDEDLRTGLDLDSLDFLAMIEGHFIAAFVKASCRASSAWPRSLVIRAAVRIRAGPRAATNSANPAYRSAMTPPRLHPCIRHRGWIRVERRRFALPYEREPVGVAVSPSARSGLR